MAVQNLHVEEFGARNSSLFPLKLTSEQANRRVLDAIMGNVHTKVVFRVDVDHATHLAQ